MIKKIFLAIVAVLGLVLTFGSEGAYDTTLSIGSEDRPTLTMAHGSWDDNLAVTHMATAALEDAGYDVELVQLDIAIIFSSVASGDADMSVSMWMPQTHGAYMDRYGDDLIDLGVHTEGAVNGLVVPEYMDVNSIDELSNEAGQIITGVEPGAGVSNRTDAAVEMYDNLSGWTHQTSSTGAMLTELTTAIENQEDIVVALWSPHWSFIEYDLKYLEDPQGAYGDGEALTGIAREGLDEDHPEAFNILNNFSLELEDVEEVMYNMHDGMSAAEAARQWVDENPEKVASWSE
jgi:glycine betaine/proline transport system substrate-binding protein